MCDPLTRKGPGGLPGVQDDYRVLPLRKTRNVHQPQRHSSFSSRERSPLVGTNGEHSYTHEFPRGRREVPRERDPDWETTGRPSGGGILTGRETTGCSSWEGPDWERDDGTSLGWGPDWERDDGVSGKYDDGGEYLTYAHR